MGPNNHQNRAWVVPVFATWCVRCCDLTADVVSFSATVSSSGASGKWPEALALFAKMNLAAVLANVILCNSLVSETRFEKWRYEV